MGRVLFQITDHSNEKSNAVVGSAPLSAANFDTEATARTALQTAIDNLTLGQVTRVTVSDITLDQPGIPTNPFAQRELKWLVSYIGETTGKLYQMEIPAPDLTDNLQPNSDEADLSSVDWQAFIAAFDDYARPADGSVESVSVVSARLVGRNI